MKVCAVDGCQGKHYGRGWCKRHYDRWKAHGSPTITLLPKGEEIGYSGAHYRVRSTRGSASRYVCPCGRPAREWAYDHDDPDELVADKGPEAGWRYSTDPARYFPMCQSCHRRFDAEARAA